MKLNNLKHRLFQTTAMRLSLHYAVYFALITGVGLTAVYWAITHFVDAQISASLEYKLANLVSLNETKGIKQLQSAIDTPSLFYLENPRYLLLVSSTGKKLAGNLYTWPEDINTDGIVRNSWIDDSHITGIPEEEEDEDEENEISDGFWPTIATTLPNGERLLITQSVSQSEDLQEFIIFAMSTILAVVIGLTLLLGWQLGRKILSRIDRINETARLISKGELSQRIPLTGRTDEFEELATHLNTMLTRIEQLLKGMREVTDNVAHDLRSPLSRLRNRLEVTLLETRNQQEYQNTIQQSVDDIDGLIKTFNALLEISQVEAGSFRGDWQAVNLSELVEDITDLYHTQAEDQQQRFHITIEPHLEVIGSRHLLSQLLSNLLENAFKFTPQNGLIKTHLFSDDKYITLTISDSGPGIPEHEKLRVLKRFVRLDKARSTEGNGLGLSLVHATTSLHGGVLKLEDNHPGLRVSLVFPKKPHPQNKNNWR